MSSQRLSQHSRNSTVQILLSPLIFAEGEIVTIVRSLLCCALAAACSKSEPPSSSAPSSATRTSPAKDPAAARKLIASGAVVIDVRTAEEYAEDHLPQAVNIPVQEVSSRMNEVATLVANDKARPIVVYCGAGPRAAKAKTQLDAAGYSEVVNGGGLDDLR
jgi:rhodanese-related sulfurtransferase